MDWYQQLQQAVRAAIDVRQTDIEGMSDEALQTMLVKTIEQSAYWQQVPADMPRERVLQRLLDDLIGLGPLEPLLRDDSVSEIMVNSPSQVFVERAGQLQPCTCRFTDEQAVRQIIERIVSRVGRRVDESCPMADARLACGARVNVVIPPLALKGSSLTIRKFSRHILHIDDLVKRGACSTQLAAFLRLAVESKRNIVVSGGTGTGKTTLLNVLANWIGEHERVITIEDSAELSLAHPNLVSLEARPANQERQGEVSIRQLVINALRMRPDRIVVGECRSGESLDMLQAMNTGHAGSLTTLHANAPRDALRRLEVMVMMAGMDLPLLAIRQQVASAIDLVVQLTRLPSGQRLIDRVTEVQGLEGDVLRLADIFISELPSQHAAQSSGEVPRFYDELSGEARERGMQLLAPPAAEEAAWPCG